MSMEKKTKASSVIAELCGDETIVNDVERNLVATRFVSMLTEERVRKDISQKDVAKKMGASISKVSRFEASKDEDLRLGDIRDYLSAIGLDVSVAFFDKSTTTANQIKHYVFEIERLLGHLTTLAKKCGDDQSIVDGIARFRGEVLYNFLVKYMQTGKDFPVVYDNKSLELAKYEQPTSSPTRV